MDSWEPSESLCCLPVTKPLSHLLSSRFYFPSQHMSPPSLFLCKWLLLSFFHICGVKTSNSGLILQQYVQPWSALRLRRLQVLEELLCVPARLCPAGCCGCHTEPWGLSRTWHLSPKPRASLAQWLPEAVPGLCWVSCPSWAKMWLFVFFLTSHKWF